MKRAALEGVRAVRIFRAHVIRQEPQRHETDEARGLEASRLREGRPIAGREPSRFRFHHSAKAFGYPTLQEEKAWLEYQDQLLESDLSNLERHQRRRLRAM